MSVSVLFKGSLPMTIVSSGISSMKHFLSVSPMWKYNAEAIGSRAASENTSLDHIFGVPLADKF